MAGDPGVQVRLGEAGGRWLLLATILGSGMAMLDRTVVNVALPTIGRDLNAGLSGLQWTVSAYTLTLAALILPGGSLGDRQGRRRVFTIGAVWFALASLGCAVAPSIEVLIAARAVQGIGGALLTPGSLSIIESTFAPEHRGRAIGAWSGLTGVASAVGPLLGGWLVDALSWRFVFLINLPLAAVVVAVAFRHVPESSDPDAARRLDLLGTLFSAAGLAGVTYALISGAEQGLDVTTAVIGIAGVTGLIAFVLTERVRQHPMLPLGIFRSRQFSAANLVTLAVYAALGGVFFLLVLHLQVVAGFSALVAGAALLPVTLIMLTLSSYAGGLAQRIGPRLPMAVGPIVAAAGLLLTLRIGTDASYVADVLPAVAVFGLGLATTVAPLTTTALAAAPEQHSGLASGVNNAVARTAGLLAVATLPIVAGLSGNDYRQPAQFAEGFQIAMLVCAGLLVAGGALAAVAISNRLPPFPRAALARSAGAGHSHCAVEEPPAAQPAGPATAGG